jgi:hypothetical protein
MREMKQFVEWELAREAEVLRENLPQCNFVHLKFNMKLPGMKTECLTA